MKRPDKLTDVLQIARQCLENGNYRPTFHSECRQYERAITLLDACYVIETGYRVPKYDQFKNEWQAWNYAIEGKTIQEDTIRVIISFDIDMMLIITVISPGQKK